MYRHFMYEHEDPRKRQKYVEEFSKEEIVITCNCAS